MAPPAPWGRARGRPRGYATGCAVPRGRFGQTRGQRTPAGVPLRTAPRPGMLQGRTAGNGHGSNALGPPIDSARFSRRPVQRGRARRDAGRRPARFSSLDDLCFASLFFVSLADSWAFLHITKRSQRQILRFLLLIGTFVILFTWLASPAWNGKWLWCESSHPIGSTPTTAFSFPDRRGATA